MFVFRSLLIILFFIFLQIKLFSQTIETEIGEKIESIAEEAGEDADYSFLTEHFQKLKESPLALNQASREELEQSGLFNNTQINSLLVHIKANGKLIDIAELQVIEGFDKEFINSIQPYTTLEKQTLIKGISFQDLLNNGKHQLIFRTQRTLEQPKAYRDKKYLGSPYKIYTRYKYAFKKNLSAGITLEKDPGEKIYPKGLDYNSFHLIYKNSGVIKTIALGDYYLSYGQGLIFWSGLSFSKTPEVLAIQKFQKGIKEYTATDENNFMRGAAVSFGLGKFTTDLFYSSNKIDANISKVENEEVLEVSSLQITGYHRTESELSDKDAITETIYGSHISYKDKSFNIGTTAAINTFSSIINPRSESYNILSVPNKRNYNLGLDYNLSYKNFSFFGESGMSSGGGLAFIHGTVVSLHPKLNVSILHRSYSTDFLTIKGQAFGEGYKTNNEKGFYTGISIKINSALNLSGYYDVFTFPWLKYQVNAPSSGSDYMILLNYKPSKVVEMHVRYKTKSKEENISAEVPINYLTTFKQENYRLHTSFKASQVITLRNRIEFTTLTKGKGMLCYQDILFHPLKFPMGLSFRYAIFDTDTYDSRIYAYENDVLYSFSIPAYYFKGQRTYMTLHYRITRHFDFWLRYATTIYENRSSIGSGNDEISGNQKTDLTFQLRCEF
jgi:hypothetical protein